MKKIKKIIFIIIIIIIILIGVLIVLNKKNTDNGINNKGEFIEQEDARALIIKDMKEVDSRSDYYIIKNILNRYISYINQYNKDSYYSKVEGEVKVTDEDKKEYLNIISNFYDKEYIEKNNFNTKDIVNDIQIYKGYDNVRIEKMYCQNINEYISLYMVQAILVNGNKESNETLKVLIKLDIQNATFAVVPRDFYKNVKIGESIQYSDAEIEKNLYNKYEYKYIDDIQIVNDLKEISALTFEKYLVNKVDGYKEYVCKDQYENLYIFHEKAVMDVTLMLDTYTLDNETFDKKYKGSDTQYKVMMNIDKVRQMMNARDYRTMFNYLDETFRTTYFENNIEKFKIKSLPLLL